MQYCVSPSEEKRRKKNNLPVLYILTLVLSCCFLVPLGVLLVMNTLEDEWYVDVKAYKLIVFEILRVFFVSLCNTKKH